MFDANAQGPQVQVHVPKGTRTTCSVCGRIRKAYCDGTCKGCYDKRFCRSGPCSVCGRTRSLKAKAMCEPCYRFDRRTRPESQEVGQRKRVDRPEDFAAAKAREGDFVDRVLPLVEAYVTRWYRKYGGDVLEEALAEAGGLAWVQFVRHLADGKDPVAGAVNLAKDVRRLVWRFIGVTGAAPPKDVLSFRARMEKGVRLADVEDPNGFFAADRPDPGDEAGWNLDLEDFLGGLSPNARALLEDRLDGRSWEELKGYGLPETVLEFFRDEIRAKYLKKFSAPAGVK